MNNEIEQGAQWYYVSIPTYDAPMDYKGWVRVEDTVAYDIDAAKKLQGDVTVPAGSAVIESYDFPNFNGKVTEQILSYDIRGRITHTQGGYVQLSCPGGVTYWVKDVVVKRPNVDISTENIMGEKEDEFEKIFHLTRVKLCYIEDSFRRMIFHLNHGNNDEVRQLLTDNIEIADRTLKTSYMDEPFILPDEDFYYAIDLYDINLEKGEGAIIYEFFDSDNERLYFCIAKFREEGRNWYLDSILLTQNPG